MTYILLVPLIPFDSAPFCPISKLKGVKSKKAKKTKTVSLFYEDTRRNADGTWKGGADSSLIPHEDCPYDDDYVPGDEYDYDFCYSHVCLVDKPSTKVSFFYQSHWFIDLGAFNHIMPYLEDFSNLLQGEHLASTCILTMHGPGMVVLKQDQPKAPTVLLIGVWYTPEAAHRLLSVIALTIQGFTCKITDKIKIWNKQGKLVIQATALLPSTPLHWFQSKLIIPTGVVYSL